jgi:hypothetical protein
VELNVLLLVVYHVTDDKEKQEIIIITVSSDAHKHLFDSAFLSDGRLRTDDKNHKIYQIFDEVIYN